MRIYLLLAMAASLSFVGASCGIKGVGDPCIPEDEYLNNFSGFSQSEVNVESRSFQCLTRVCLVNHFQGRVSCPYGQVEDPLAEDSGLSTCMGTLENRNSASCQPGGADHQVSCQVPERDGSKWEDRILPPVGPQLKDRQAQDAVYCSCRCEGPNGETGDGFCECPSGFECAELVEDLGLGKGQLAGSYCIREGTEYNPGFPARDECASGSANCNAEYNISFPPNGVRSGTNQNEDTGSCVPPGAYCDKDQSCCGAVVAVTCIDQASETDDTSRNCNGTCVSDTQCYHPPSEADEDQLPEGTTYASLSDEQKQSVENMQEVVRDDCPPEGICNERP